MFSKLQRMARTFRRNMMAVRDKAGLTPHAGSQPLIPLRRPNLEDDHARSTRHRGWPRQCWWPTSRCTRTRRHSHPRCPARGTARAAIGLGCSRCWRRLRRGHRRDNQQLGPTSRVYGTDINAQRIAEIEQAATKAALANVVALEGAPASTRICQKPAAMRCSCGTCIITSPILQR